MFQCANPACFEVFDKPAGVGELNVGGIGMTPCCRYPWWYEGRFELDVLGLSVLVDDGRRNLKGPTHVVVHCPKCRGTVGLMDAGFFHDKGAPAIWHEGCTSIGWRT